jgi:hypothetical protein
MGATAADSTAATSATDFDASFGPSQNVAPTFISTTGFTANMGVAAGNTFSNTRYYSYSWIAWGV